MLTAPDRRILRARTGKISRGFLRVNYLQVLDILAKIGKNP